MAQEQGTAISFAKATEVKVIDSHTYEIELVDDWCIGSVPHGGYVTSCFQYVASKHFEVTHPKQKQLHTIAMHMSFARRTEIGPARFVVKDVKIGRGTSTLHITLVQHGQEEVLCYLIQSNIDTAEGASFDTAWRLPSPEPLPVDVTQLKAGLDTHWAEQKHMPFTNFRKASKRIRWFFPRKGQQARAVTEQWMCLSNGERFTNESLGFVSDTFPQMVETLKGPNHYDIKPEGQQQPSQAGANSWYPTLLLNLDVKKALPKEGVEWLFTRVAAKQIKNGRLDYEIIIMDETGDLVALSHHVVMVLDVKRNTAQRTKKPSGASKI